MGTLFNVYAGVVLAGITLRCCEIAYTAWYRRKWQKEMASASREFNDNMGKLLDKLSPQESERYVGKARAN